jgi:superoxide dismutase, Cu-Zn family
MDREGRHTYIQKASARPSAFFTTCLSVFTVMKPSSFLALLPRSWACALWIVAGSTTSVFADPVSIHPKAAAVAHLKPGKQSDVAGTVQFVPEKDGIRIIVHVMNLRPGDHGFHVHEKGDLSAPDLSSAGGHFNPTSHPHAGPDADRRHIGDLGNLTADSNGVVKTERIDKKIFLDGPNSILGRSVIIHQNPDDFKSQPSGNAGDRVAGGVIEKVKR